MTTQNKERSCERDKLLVLDIIASMPEISAVGWLEFHLLCADRFSAHWSGPFNHRMARAADAISALREGEYPRLSEVWGVIHFSRGDRQYSATENHILEIVAAMPDTAAMGREELNLLCAESLPRPLAGERDSRMVRVSAAIVDLCRGKDARFRDIGGVIHFLVA